MSQKLNSITKQMIRDLQDDLQEMLELDSNIEVVWRMESLQNNKAFQKSADLIRKSLEKSNSDD